MVVFISLMNNYQSRLSREIKQSSTKYYVRVEALTRLFSSYDVIYHIHIL